MKISLFTLMTILFSSATLAQEVLVEFNHLLTKSELSQLQTKLNAAKISKLTPTTTSFFLDRVYLVKSKTNSSKQISYLLSQNKNVKSIEENHLLQINAFAQKNDDPYFNYQWHLNNNGKSFFNTKDGGTAGVDVGFEKAKELVGQSKTQKNIIVAVLDSGIDYNHPDLKNNLAFNMAECEKDGSIPFMPSEDKDGNKYIGDCLGWNFAAVDESTNEKRVPLDDDGHGTHVAGIVAAVSKNDLGVSSLSDGRIKILPLKVFDSSHNVSNEIEKTDGERNVRVTRADIFLRAISYAINAKVDVINMSLGWNNLIDNALLRRALSDATYKFGISVVAAAGNDSNYATVYPCIYEFVICVGAVNSRGEIANFSNYGSSVDVLAPGADILSTWPISDADRFKSLVFGIHGYDIYSGTSQAAPLVSSVIATLKLLSPEANLAQIKRQLLQLAGPSIYENGKNQSLRGMVSFNNWNAQNKPLILPTFKWARTLNYNKDKKSTLTIPLTNYSDKEVVLKARLKTNNETIKVVSESELSITMKPLEVASLKFLVDITDTGVDNNINFTIDLEYDNQINSYTHKMKLARNIFGDAEIVKKEVKLQSDTSLTYTLIAQTLTTLKNVYNYDNPRANDEFYVPFTGKRENNELYQKITFFKSTPQSFAEVASINIESANQLKAVVKFSKNGVGTYLIVTIRLNREDRVIEEHFNFFDAQFKPIHNLKVALDYLTFNPTTGNNEITTWEDIDTTAFVATKVDNKTIYLPVFSKKRSFVPPSQVPNDGFNDVTQFPRTQLYAVDTKLNIYKAILTNEFMDKLKNELSAASTDSVEVVKINPNKEAGFDAYLSIGKLSLQRLYHFAFTDKFNYTATALKGNLDLSFDFSLPLNLKNNNNANGLVGTKNLFGNKISIKSIEGNQIRSLVVTGKGAETPVYLSSFQAEDTNFSHGVFDGKNLLFISGQGVDSYPLEKLSFSTQPNFYQRMFYPISINSENGKLAAYYVNQSQITQDVLEIIVHNKEQTIAPARLTFIPTPGCAALNPHYDAANKETFYQQICRPDPKANQWEIHTLPLNM